MVAGRWAALLIAVAALLMSGADTRAQAPREAFPTLEAVLEVRDIGGFRRGLDLAPGGRAISLIVREKSVATNLYRHPVIVIDTRTGAARTLADAGEIILNDDDGQPNGTPIDRTALWSSDGAWLAYMRASHGAVELWRVRARGGRPQRIASGPGDVRRFVWMRGALIYETATPRAPLDQQWQDALRDGFRVDARFDAASRLSPMPDLDQGGVWVWDHGRHRAATPDEAGRLDASQSSAPAPARGPAMAMPSPAEHGGANGRVWFDLFNSADLSHAPTLGVFRHVSRAPAERCEDELCRGAIRQVWWGADNDIYLLRTEGFARSDTGIYLWRGDTVRLVRRIEGVMQDCAFAHDAIFCIEDASLQPRRLVRIDVQSGRMAPLYDPNPHWSSYRLPRLERIDVHDRYGNPSFAYLLYPANYDPLRTYPAVLVQYRARGFLRAGVGGEYPVYEFARRGYFVINFERPNMDHVSQTAGHDAWQRETELNHIEQLAKQSALDAILARLRTRGDVDMSRIAVTGLSDGAETLFWALTHGNQFAVAVAGTPPTDASVWALSSETNRTRLASFGLADDRPGRDSEWLHWWSEMAPSQRVERMRAPVLMQVSDDEALTAFPFYARMREQNRPVELYIYPESHHVRHLPSQLLAGQQRCLDWIDFWLTGTARPDAADPERVARWTALREGGPAP